MLKRNILGNTALISALASAGLLTVPAGANAADSLEAALKESTAKLSFRPRYENVTQESPAPGASPAHSDAFTLKTRLTFTTGSFFDTSAVLEFDDVTALKDEDYNDTAGNGQDNPAIADPEGTEVNQVYLSYKGLDKTDIRYGRQRILLDNERFVGGVGWRQNEQTYDSLSVTNTSIPNLTGFLAHLYNVNRITGEDADNGRYHMDSTLLNLKYAIAGVGAVSGYYYDLDYLEELPAASSKTMGVRFAGSTKLDPVTLGYEAEYATQSESADNPTDFDADYYLLGASVTFDIFTVGIAQEVLGADEDAGVAFSTPLATLHKFQGWADQFLATPNTGIEDTYVTFKVVLPMGMDLLAMYHQFESDADRADDNEYGDEIDVALTKKFSNGATIQLKYVDFSGNEDGLKTDDVSKVWVMATYEI